MSQVGLKTIQKVKKIRYDKTIPMSTLQPNWKSALYIKEGGSKFVYQVHNRNESRVTCVTTPIHLPGASAVPIQCLISLTEGIGVFLYQNNISGFELHPILLKYKVVWSKKPSVKLNGTDGVRILPHIITTPMI